MTDQIKIKQYPYLPNGQLRNGALKESIKKNTLEFTGNVRCDMPHKIRSTNILISSEKGSNNMQRELEKILRLPGQSQFRDRRDQQREI